MSVIEKLSSISNTITNLMNFVSTDDLVKEDFNEYMNTISAQKLSPAQSQAMVIPYIFERRLTEDRKTIVDLYLENTSKIDKFDKKILKALGKSFSSIFEIKKVRQNGFDFYNLINEKTYNVISLVKMTNYRGVFAGQYALGRIFKFEDEYYILEISNVVSPAQKDEIEQFAIAKIIEKPEDVYEDNKDKLKEIQSQIKSFSKKFIECFECDEVITTNKYADNIINIFNNYCESPDEFNKEEIDENIKAIDEYKFFDVPDFNNSYDNFVEKSMGGFSSHRAIYDVGIVYDKELGLFAMPFYATFSKIFEVDDYTSINGYEACVKSFLENDKIPHTILTRVAEKNPNFIEIVNKILGTSYSLEELLSHYKPDSMEKKIFSSTSVLYSSKVFAQVMGFVVDKQEAPEKIEYKNVGRNEPCPCGSGKKFKKCCMLK